MFEPAHSLAAMPLLLAALESPTARLSASMTRHHPTETAWLKGAGLLKGAGHEPVTTVQDDHSDLPVAVTWSENGSYGYFSESAGWVPVDNEKLETLDVDVPALCQVLTRRLSLPSKAFTAIVRDHLWDLGSTYLGHRPTPTPILFGRWLSDPQVWAQIELALKNRPSTHRRLLITSTDSARLPSQPDKCVVVSVADVVDAGVSLEIDPDVLNLRLAGVPVLDKAEPLTITGEGREVRFLGQIYRFKGDKQRLVICLLHARLRKGDLRVSSAEIAAELELAPTTRVRDLFKHHEAWGRLLDQKAGMCGFCWPEGTR
jgi:hypothetical protein